MSSDSHRHSKPSSGRPSPRTPKEPKHPSTPHSSSSHKLQGQSSSYTYSPNTIAARVSSQDTGNSTSISNPTSQSSQNSNPEPLGGFSTTPNDLLSIAGWAYPPETPCHWQDITGHSVQTSACPYHSSMIRPENGMLYPGYGLAPLERWLDEGVRDGGVVALQLGYHTGLECTCIAIQDGDYPAARE